MPHQTQRLKALIDELYDLSNDARREIEPFDPDGTNKQYSMQAEAYWYAARQLEEIIDGPREE